MRLHERCHAARHKSIQASIDSLTLPGDQGVLAWNGIERMHYVDGYFDHVLRFERAPSGEVGWKKLKVKLPGIGIASRGKRLKVSR